MYDLQIYKNSTEVYFVVAILVDYKKSCVPYHTVQIKILLQDKICLTASHVIHTYKVCLCISRASQFENCSNPNTLLYPDQM